MSEAYVEFITLWVRYETKDETGETRRERNKRFNVTSPDFEPPSPFHYLWEWFVDLNADRSLDNNGYMKTLTATAIKSWSELTDTVIRPSEFRLLREIDKAFVTETNKEISDSRLRVQENARHSGSRNGGGFARR